MQIGLLMLKTLEPHSPQAHTERAREREGGSERGIEGRRVERTDVGSERASEKGRHGAREKSEREEKAREREIQRESARARERERERERRDKERENLRTDAAVGSAEEIGEDCDLRTLRTFNKNKTKN